MNIMMLFYTGSSLLNALRSLGYARLSRLDPVQNNYHPVRSPISVSYLSSHPNMIVRLFRRSKQLDDLPEETVFLDKDRGKPGLAMCSRASR